MAHVIPNDISSSTLAQLVLIKARLDLLLAKTDFEARINTLGQKVMASSTPIVLASDQTIISINNTQWLGSTLPTVAQKVMASSIPVVVASDQSKVNVSLEVLTLIVTSTGAVNTIITATLPASAGNFHYIVAIELIKLYSVLGVANGAGVIITSTNLVGNPAWTTEQLASVAGTAIKVIDIQYNRPIKSSVINTATTFVAPAQLQTIWRWNIYYYTAP